MLMTRSLSGSKRAELVYGLNRANAHLAQRSLLLLLFADVDTDAPS